MKAILDLTKAIKNQSFYDRQFQEMGTEKNILIVSPQLTAKHLYKYLLPYYCFYNEKVKLAITDLDKYNPYEQIVRLKHNLTSNEILWADFIIFPFTTQDLSREGDLYLAIRETNPSAKICFYVDFNFYELTNGHPHYELFNRFPDIINQVERNIINSDLVITHNVELQQYLINKFTNLSKDKYSNYEIYTEFGSLPYLIDEEIVLQNVEFESYIPQSVINRKDIFKKIAETADEVKKEDLKKKTKSKRVNSSTATPKKAQAKTKRVSSKKAKDEEEAIDTSSDIKFEKLPKEYRIGIICSISNYEDIQYYNAEFRAINEKYGEQVNLIFIGYDYDEDKKKILDGVNFEYVKQVSIIHFFKQIKSLNLDAVFIPLIKNTYNTTSETYNKYLECSLFNIPVIVPDIYPYNAIIVEKYNGFMFSDKNNFLSYLDELLKSPEIINQVSIHCASDIKSKYLYNDTNIRILSDMFEKK